MLLRKWSIKKWAIWSPSGKSEMVRGTVVVGPSTHSVRSLIYAIDLAWGRANRTQKWFVFYGFLGPIHVWDFLVSVIVISWDSWLHHRSLRLCCTAVLLGANPVGECASDRAVSYQSVEGIYTFENDFGCVLQKGSDSPEPGLRTSLPEEKTQVGGTHVSFVYQSARPQIRLVLTWRNKFPFHSTTYLSCFQMQKPPPHPHTLHSPSLSLSPLIPAWNGFLPNEDNPALAVYSLGYLPGLRTVHNRLCRFYLFLPECTEEFLLLLWLRWHFSFKPLYLWCITFSLNCMLDQNLSSVVSI